MFEIEILEIPENCDCDQTHTENLHLKATVSRLTSELEENEKQKLQLVETLQNALKIKTKEVDTSKRAMKSLQHSKTVLEEKFKTMQDTFLSKKTPSSVDVSNNLYANNNSTIEKSSPAIAS